MSVRKQFDLGRRPAGTRACRGTRAARCGPSSCTIGSPNRGPSSRLRASSSSPSWSGLKASFEQALPAIEKYIKTTHEQWSEYVEARIEPTIAQRLDARLPSAFERTIGISMNFDKELMSLFSEVGLWERLQKQAPYKCAELASQREKYDLLRQNVLQVVSDYNGILAMLGAPERGELFADRIRYLDEGSTRAFKKVRGPLREVHTEDLFMADAAGKFCAEVNKAVTLYKDTMRKVRQNLALVAETRVIKMIEESSPTANWPHGHEVAQGGDRGTVQGASRGDARGAGQVLRADVRAGQRGRPARVASRDAIARLDDLDGQSRFEWRLKNLCSNWPGRSTVISARRWCPCSPRQTC